MHWKKVSVTAYLIVCGCLTYGQNLIPNFSFEQHKGCPQGISLLRRKWVLNEWKPGDGGTPDYYHRCATHEVSIPYNWAGKTQPVHGDAYAGIYLWGGYKEFLQVTLSDSLEKGAQYHLEGYFQIASNSHFVVGDISVLFYHENEDFKYLAPQIVLSKKDPLDGSPFEWEKISASFIAKGGETQMIIGHLNGQVETKATEIFINKDKEFQLKNRSYAYLDHFRLWKEGSEVPADSSFSTPTPDKFTLSDINFELDSYLLKDTAKVALQPLVDYLGNLGDRGFLVLISGYTDDIGEFRYNRRLSKNRAKSVALYLLKNGIPKNLLKTFGKGELDPLYPNDNDVNRQKNRRVEIVIREL